MASPPALELALRTLAREYARRLAAVACGSNIDAIAGLELTPTVSPAPPPPSVPERPHLVPLGQNPTGLGSRVRAKSVETAHAMAAAVASVPWPARSRELQALLGLSKTQFIRVAHLAIRMGLVHRTGQKAGMQYFIGPAQPKPTRAGSPRAAPRRSAPRQLRERRAK